LCHISLKNDTVLPVLHVSGFDRVRRQMSRIVAKTSTSVTISPALYFDLPSGLAPLLNVATRQGEAIGIEDLAIDAQNSSTYNPLIGFEQSIGCWVKNVSMSKTPNYFIRLGDSLQCEVRHCDLRGSQTAGSNHSGILPENVTACLVEDNIIIDMFPHIEVNHGCTGNVFAYNFCEGNGSMGVMGVSIDSNHGPHNSYNLYEGNVASKFQSDGYFGSNSEDTLFRNWFHGTSTATDQFGICVYLNRLARNINIIGNVLGRSGNDPATGQPLVYVYNNNVGGTWGGLNYSQRFIYAFGLPNLGNGGFNGSYAQPSLGTTWPSYNILGTLTTRTSDTAGIITLSKGTVDANLYPITVTWAAGLRASLSSGAVSGSTVPILDSLGLSSGSILPSAGTATQVWVGPSGFQELDLDVNATALTKGNWNAKDGGTPTSEALGAEVLPSSLYRSSKPAWFGDLAWPAFTPQSPNQNYGAIPAGYRYLYGKEPTGAGNPPVNTAPSQVRVTIQTQ
jgi:hypothetical protein